MTFSTLYSLKKYFWMGCARTSLCSIERKKRETHSRDILRMREELFPLCLYPSLQITLRLCTNFCNIRHPWSVTANSVLLSGHAKTWLLFFILTTNCALNQTDAEQCTQVAHKRLMPFPSKKEGTQAYHKYRQPTQKGLPPSNQLHCEEYSPCTHQIVSELFSYVNSKRQGWL